METVSAYGNVNVRDTWLIPCVVAASGHTSAVVKAIHPTPGPLMASRIAAAAALTSDPRQGDGRKPFWTFLPAKLLHSDPSKDPKLFAL